MRNSSTLAAAFVFAAIPSASLAQSCGDVLIETKINRSLDREQELALSILVDDEEEYQNAVNSGASGSYGLFSAQGNYDEFRAKRERHLQEEDFKLSNAEAERLVTSFIPETATQAWLQCQIGANGGVRLRAEDITRDAVTVIVHWRPLHGHNQALRIDSLEVRGSTTSSEEVRDRLPTGWLGPNDQILILDRKPGEELRLTIGIGGKVDRFLLPVFRKPVVVPPPEPRESITIRARDFSDSLNIQVGVLPYGADVIHNAPDYNVDKRNMAEYRVNTNQGGRYHVQIEYAAMDVRPVNVFINDKMALEGVLDKATGCWFENCQQWANVGTVTLSTGTNRLRIDRSSVFPHIRNILLLPVN